MLDTVSEPTLRLLLRALALQVDFGLLGDELRMQIHIARRLKSEREETLAEAQQVLSRLVAQEEANESAKH